MKCLYCDVELSNPKARFCSPSHKMSFRREGMSIPINEVEAPKKEYGMGEDPDIYYQGEITPEVEALLAMIFSDYERDNPGFKCKPYMRRGVRILTLWERMKIKQYMDREMLEQAIDEAAGTMEASVGVVPEGATATGTEFLPEFTPGFCAKCRAKRLVKTVTYDDIDGETYTEDVCEKHYIELDKFLKR